MIRRLATVFLVTNNLSITACNDNSFSAPKNDKAALSHYVETKQPRIKVVGSGAESLKKGDAVECHIPLESLDEKLLDDAGYHPEATTQNVFATYFFYNSTNPEVAKAVIQGTKPGLAVARYELFDGRSSRPEIQRAFRGSADKKEDSISCKVQLRFEDRTATSLLSASLKIEDTPPTLKIVSGSLLQKSLVPGQAISEVRLQSSDADGDDVQIVLENNTCAPTVKLSTHKIFGSIPSNFAKSHCEISVKAVAAGVSSESVVVQFEVFSGIVNSELSNTPAAYSNIESLNVAVGGENVDFYKYSLSTQSISCEDASYSSEWISASTPITAATEADGDKRLCVIGRSKHGIEEKPKDASAANWTKDTIAPNSTDLTLANLPAGVSTHSSIDIPISGNGFAFYRYKISNANCSSSSNFSEKISTSTNITENLNSLLDGPIYLCIKAVDEAGNESDVKLSNWTKDTTAPTAILSNTPQNPSNTSSLNVSVSNSDMQDYQYALITSGSCALATYSSFQTGQISEALSLETTYTLCVKARDAAGNTQSVATSYSWTRDATPPAVAGIALSNVPSGTNNTTSLNVGVSGSGITQYQFKLDSTDTCLAGGYSASYSVANSISNNISSIPEGNVFLCVKALDAAGNVSDPKVASWTKDTLAPTASDILVSGVPDPVSNITSLDVTVSNVTSYRYKISNTNNCTTDAGYSVSDVLVSTHITDDISSLAEGDVYLCLRAKDETGNLTSALNAKVVTWNKNTTSATATLANTPNTDSSLTSLDVTVSGTNVDTYIYALLGPNSASTCANATYSSETSAYSTSTHITDSLAGDGTYLLCVKSITAGGTLQTVATSHTWTKDTVAPSAADIGLGNVPTGTNNSTSLDVEVSGNGIVSYRFKISQSSDCSVDSGYSGTDVSVGSNIQNSIAALGDGDIFLCVRAKDAAGNLTTAENAKIVNWTKDTTPPSAAEISLSNVPSGESNTTALDISVSGVSAYRFKIDSTNTCSNSSGYSGSDIPVANKISNNIATLDDGNVYLCVVGVDAYGNITQHANAKALNWTKDTEAPTAILSNLPQSATNNSSLSVAVSGTGVESYSHALLGPNPSDNCANASYNSPVASATPITDTLSGDGAYILCVKGIDASGNIQDTPTSFAWSFDTEPPSQADLTLTGVPNGTNNVTDLNVTISGSDVVSYRYKISETDTCSTDSDYSGSDVLISTSITSSLSALNDGSIFLCVRGKDSAGNLTAAANAKKVSWTKDATAPLNSEINLSSLPNNESNVTTLDVSVSGVTAYRFKISATNTCSNSSGYSSSDIPVATKITDDIAGLDDGSIFLCIVGVDAVGNTTAVADAKVVSWTKDTVAPTNAEISLTGLPSSESNSPSLSVTVTGGGTTHYKRVFKSDGSPCSQGDFDAESWSSVATSITDSIGSDGAKRLCVIARDTALNATAIASAKTFAWEQDTLAPSAGDITLAGTPSDPNNSSADLDVTVGGTDVLQYQYAFTTSLQTCTAASYNGGWLAVSSKIAESMGADANKKRLCVIARDGAGNETLVANAKLYDWLQDTTSPVADDVTLTGAPADPSNGTGNLNVEIGGVSAGGANITSYQYAYTTSATNCASATYNGSWVNVETHITEPIGSDSDKKRLCVKLQDAAGNMQSSTEAKTYDWKQDTVAPVAGDITLNDIPLESDDEMNISISGSEIAAYKYKFDENGATDCSSATGYSLSWISVSTPITGNVGGNGNKRLCVIGKDTATNEAVASGTSAKVQNWTTNVFPKPTSIAVLETSSGKVTLNWSPVSGATSYNLYWATASGVTKLSNKISGLTETSYTHSGLTNGTSYFYRVTAQDATSESSLSDDEVTGTPNTENMPLSSNICFNGDAYASAQDGAGNTYLGGSFTEAGNCTGNGISLSTSTALPEHSISTIDRVYGDVTASIPDGNGGWYIAGTFKSVGNYLRNGIAHIQADGKVNPSWNPNPNGSVDALVKVGTNIYFGGYFSSVGGVARTNLAAVSTSGVLQSWSPSTDSNILAMVNYGSNIYIGGPFTTVNGTTRNRLAAISTSGSLQSWNPNADNYVLSMAISGTTIYIGGTFNNIGATGRMRLAAISTSGSLLSWNPNADNGGSFKAIAVSGSTVYVGGSFSSINGTARSHLAAISTSGSLLSWNPNPNSSIHSLAVSGSNVYVAGLFTTIGGTTRNRIAAISTSGTLQSWNPSAPFEVRTLSVSGSYIYVGGDFSYLGGTTRNRLAALDSNGALLNWNPNANGTVRAMGISGSQIYFGGEFTSVGGTTRNRLAAVNTAGVLQSWNPNVNDVVNTLAVSGSDIYVGGDFTQIGATARNYIASLGTDGSLKAWYPATNSTVHAIAVSGNNIYLGGIFTSIGGTGRSKLGVVDTAGNLLSWNPNLFTLTGGVFSMAINGSYLYVGGNFTKVGGMFGTSRNGLAAFTLAGTLQGWDPDPNIGSIDSLAVSGSNVYIGGSFSQISGTTTLRDYAVVSDAGTLLSWNPGSPEYGGVKGICFVGSKAYVKGVPVSLP